MTDDTKDIGIVFLPNQECQHYARLMTAKTKAVLPAYKQAQNNPHVTAIHIANLNEDVQDNLKQIADNFFPQFEDTCIKLPVTGIKATGGSIETGFKWLDLQFRTLEPLKTLRDEIVKKFCPLHNGTLTRMHDDPSNFIEGSQADTDIRKCGVTYSSYTPHITAWYVDLPNEAKTTVLNDVAESLIEENLIPEICYAESIAVVALERNGNAIEIIETYSLGNCLNNEEL